MVTCCCLVILILTVLSISQPSIAEINEFNIIPRNFHEAISFFDQKSKHFNSSQQKIIDYFNKYSQESSNLVSILKDSFSDLNNSVAINIQFPNLTNPCTFQLIELTLGLTKKEDWALKGDTVNILNSKCSIVLF